MFNRLFVVVALVFCLLAAAAPIEAAGGNTFPYGQCTWFAAEMRPDLIGHVWGDARQWIGEARQTGEPTGTVPATGAVAVLQAGVQGADSYGHVGIVARVGTDGWFLLEQRNWAPWPWQTTYAWFHSGWGVSFIYR